MPKTLLEVFTESKDRSLRKRNTTNRNARAKGSRAEALLAQELTGMGYEDRRTPLSAFPDINAWNNKQFLLIEDKARSSAIGVNNALSAFKRSAKLLTVVHNDAILLCYVRFNSVWRVFKWTDSGVTEGDIQTIQER